MNRHEKEAIKKARFTLTRGRTKKSETLLFVQRMRKEFRKDVEKPYFAVFNDFWCYECMTLNEAKMTLLGIYSELKYDRSTFVKNGATLQIFDKATNICLWERRK